MKNRRGLGKGLDALLSEDSDLDSPGGSESTVASAKGGEVSDKRPRMIALSDLRPGSHQPRRDFDEEGLEELADSIRRRGVLQPVLARPLGGGEGWEIVAGERRWRAARLAGLTEIPAAVREMTDREAMFAALAENLQRADLNPMERARGLSRLVEDLGMTQAEAGAEVGLSRPAVANVLRLLELSPEVQRMVEAGRLEAAHARALVGLSVEMQTEAARRIARGGLSAREAESLARRMSAAKGAGKASGDAGGEGDADVRILERELSSKLKARTEIRHRKDGGGRVTIHYGSLEGLDRVLAKLRK